MAEESRHRSSAAGIGSLFQSFKLDRIEIGIFHLEMEADRLSGEGVEARVGIPGGGAVDFVADQLAAIGQGETGKGLAGRVLNLDANTAGSGSRKVEVKLVAGEGEGAGEHCPPFEGSVDGGQAVQAHGIAADMSGGLSIVAVGVHGHFGGSGLHDVEGGVIGAGDPVVGADTGTNQSAEECAVVAQAAAGGHEDGVGGVVEILWVDVDGGSFLCGENTAIGHESGGGGKVNVGGAKVWGGLIGVEVLAGNLRVGVGEGHGRAGGPMKEVFGCSAGDGANALLRFAIVEDIAPLERGPEGDVL